MSPPGAKQKPTLLKVVPRPHGVSPDDIKARMLEAAARAAQDTRTDAQRWLGDPPPERSALASRQAAKR